VRALAIGLALVVCCAAPRAEPPGAAQAQILWTGVFQANVLGTVDQPNTAIGRTNQLGNIDKLQTTTTVPARRGVSFGLEYSLSGPAGGSLATIHIAVVPPKAGLLNPATQRRLYRETWRPSSVVVGSPTVVGYSLEHDWEVVPGLWKFEIWQGNRKIGEQTFCLVPERDDERKWQGEEPCHSAATA
jgi:Domain of unknown function (DUF3859)